MTRDHRTNDDVIVKTPSGTIASRITAVNRGDDGKVKEVRVERGGAAPIPAEDILATLPREDR